MNYANISNRLSAVVEELDEDPIDGAEVEEEQEMTEDELLEAQMSALAALLGVELPELLEADEEAVIEALGTLNARLTEAKMKFAAQGVKYGRGGLKRCSLPWAKNEKSVGTALKHAASSRSGPPGTSKAKPPKGKNPSKFGPAWMK